MVKRDQFGRRILPPVVDTGGEYGHKIIELSNTTITEKELEQIDSKLKVGSYAEYKKLYEKDSVTFSIINFMIAKIAGQGLKFNGSKRFVTFAEKWSKQIGFKFTNWFVVKDILLGGTCWLEIVPDKDMRTIESFKFLNPDTTDFLRDEKGNIILDENGEVKGFKVDIGAQSRIWTKDTVMQGGKILARSRGEDLRKRIVWFKLEGYGETEKGMPFLAPGYRSAIIRANVEDMIGESAFRGGGIVAYYEGSPPEDVQNSMAEDLKNITSKNVFLLSNKWQLDLAPIAKIEEQESLIKLLADLECGSLGVPMDILFSTGKTYKQDLTQKLIDLELRIKAYQEFLAFQMTTKVLSFLKTLWGTDAELEMEYITRMLNVKMQKARSIASWARGGLISWDPMIEKQIREIEELDTKYIEEEIVKWNDTGKGVSREESSNRKIIEYTEDNKQNESKEEESTEESKE